MGHTITIHFDPENPLAQCTGESRRANDALQDYYAMSSGRSLRGMVRLYVGRAADSTQTYAPPTTRWSTISTWSDRFRWVERVECQDGIDRRRQEVLRREAEKAAAQKWAERRLKVREDDWTVSESLRALSLKILEETPKFIKTTRKLIPGKDGAPDREIITVALDGYLAVRAIEIASKLSRLSAEMETEHTLNENVPAEDIEELRAKRWRQIEATLAEAMEIEGETTIPTEPVEEPAVDGGADA